MRKKISLILVGLVAVTIVGMELCARLVLGLGNPPLSLADEEIDYLFAPNQRCSRFGNRIDYNNLSMRQDFDVDKVYTGKRLFVVGDSVVNGGVLTDQDDLATAILTQKFPEYQVCNVSAGSWGPGNCAAYFRRYQWLVREGDVLVLEASSHDLWEDDPRESKGKIVGSRSFPSKKPFCALWDGFYRYGWPKFAAKLGIYQARNKKIDVVPELNKDELEAYNVSSLQAILSLPFEKKYLMMFRSRYESELGEPTEGERKICEVARSLGAEVFVVALDPTTEFRDTIHPNNAGQRKMAEIIYEKVH